MPQNKNNLSQEIKAPKAEPKKFRIKDGIIFLSFFINGNWQGQIDSMRLRERDSGVENFWCGQEDPKKEPSYCSPLK